MVKKSLIIGLIAIILSLCCGMCFAANDNKTSINLGNEITSSIDKTGQSMQNLTDNVFSGNTADNVRSGVNNMRTDMVEGMNNIDNGFVNMTGTNQDNNDTNNNDNNNNNDNVNNPNNAGDYTATRTTTEGTATGLNTMTTTTWMWIILAVAAIIIIAAIWYYATQTNE